MNKATSGFYGSTPLIWWLGFILVWAPIPLGSNRPWAWALLHGLIALGGIWHLFQVARNKAPLFPKQWQLLLLFGPVLIAMYLAAQLACALPEICSVDPYQTNIMLEKSLYLLLFTYLLSQNCRNHHQLKIILICILISGGLQAIYGSLLNLSGLELSPVFGIPEGEKARGSFVYQNHYANYLALCLSIAIGWMLSELSTSKQKVPLAKWLRALAELMLSRKLLLRLAIILMVVGLVLSRSRMGNAGFFTALGIVAVLALFIYRRPPPLLKWLVLSIFVLDMLLIGSMFGVEKVKQRMQDTSFVSEARDEVVMHSLPLLEEQGLTGTGGGTFYTVFPRYQQQSYSGFYDHAHNDYLQFAIELGWPVTVLLCAWLAIALWQSLYVMNKRKTKLYQGVAFGCCMAWVHMLMHSSVDFSLQAPANSLLFMTILTLAYLVRMLPGERKVAQGN
ncbi:O-antigen ligase family protein [Bowmanella sp. Y26]|uniref:O-antigen ligase family protein n=1 Tax=Bowmanella yangjiangensis TaxID=2811230 RepID=UPI001BDDB169|nr:O-antigen ligase family protein [Bowmanella yangjiangensis]MBT1064570.1 O-antigen ligase family protein [Bowmanella yangjiangensis]